MPNMIIRANSATGIFGSSDPGPGEGVFFNPDIGLLANGGSLRKSGGGPFDDTNGPVLVQSVVTRPGGQSKCIRLAYDADEAECNLNVTSDTFPANTTTLYCRRWEMWDASWSNNWPVGFKTARYFTEGQSYCSEKYIWQRYGGVLNVGTRNNPVWGYNHATYNEEYEVAYTEERIFAAQWHLIETWLELNSGVDVADGKLWGWIDGAQVVNDNNRRYRKTADGGTINGTAWRSMWFGGNCSFSPENNGWPFSLTGPTTRYRYVDSPYLSTTLDH